MNEPFSNSEYYADKEFWNNRFNKSKGFFDWYVGWKELKPYMVDLFDEDSKILMVGCGNSKMSELMYKDNYKNIVNIDISDNIIEKMKNTYQDNFENMMFMEMDATAMTFEDNSFDFVIDKGTSDALFCSKNPDIPDRLLTEMFRVTKVGSHFALVTYAEPELRLKYFMDALPKFKYELICKQVSLSFTSNLINSLRNNSSDFSISEGLKDKSVLTNSLLDAYSSKLDEEIKLETDEESINEKKKKLFQLKVLKLAMKKKRDRESEETGIVSDGKNDERTEKFNSRRTCCYLYIFKKVVE